MPDKVAMERELLRVLWGPMGIGISLHAKHICMLGREATHGCDTQTASQPSDREAPRLLVL
jgi:hypothetical protein